MLKGADKSIPLLSDVPLREPVGDGGDSAIEDTAATASAIAF